MKQSFTKKCLTDALFLLLEERSFEEISVLCLTQKAGVGRATFYRNYTSIEQIIDDYLTGVFEHRSAMQPESVEESIFNIFEGLRKEKVRLLLLNRRNLLNHLNEQLLNATVLQINELGVLNNRYQPYFFAGAAAAMIIAWIRFDMEESSEEMTKLFMQSLKGYMKI